MLYGIYISFFFTVVLCGRACFYLFGLYIVTFNCPGFPRSNINLTQNTLIINGAN